MKKPFIFSEILAHVRMESNKGLLGYHGNVSETLVTTLLEESISMAWAPESTWPLPPCFLRGYALWIVERRQLLGGQYPAWFTETDYPLEPRDPVPSPPPSPVDEPDDPMDELKMMMDDHMRQLDEEETVSSPSWKAQMEAIRGVDDTNHCKSSGNTSSAQEIPFASRQAEDTTPPLEGDFDQALASKPTLSPSSLNCHEVQTVVVETEVLASSLSRKRPATDYPDEDLESKPAKRARSLMPAEEIPETLKSKVPSRATSFLAYTRACRSKLSWNRARPGHPLHRDDGIVPEAPDVETLVRDSPAATVTHANSEERGLGALVQRVVSIVRGWIGMGHPAPVAATISQWEMSPEDRKQLKGKFPAVESDCYLELQKESSLGPVQRKVDHGTAYAPYPDGHTRGERENRRLKFKASLIDAENDRSRLSQSPSIHLDRLLPHSLPRSRPPRPRSSRVLEQPLHSATVPLFVRDDSCTSRTTSAFQHILPIQDPAKAQSAEEMPAEVKHTDEPAGMEYGEGDSITELATLTVVHGEEAAPSEKDHATEESLAVDTPSVITQQAALAPTSAPLRRSGRSCRPVEETRAAAPVARASSRKRKNPISSVNPAIQRKPKRTATKASVLAADRLGDESGSTSLRRSARNKPKT